MGLLMRVETLLAGGGSAELRGGAGPEETAKDVDRVQRAEQGTQWGSDKARDEPGLGFAGTPNKSAVMRRGACFQVLSIPLEELAVTHKVVDMGGRRH